MSFAIGSANPISSSTASSAPPASIKPERALDAITSVKRPLGEALAQWSGRSSAEQLRIASGVPDARTELVRVEVRNGRVLVRPEDRLRSDLPNIDLPNNVGARGFSPGLTTHDYLIPFLAPASLRGPAGLAAVGRALTDNPTPGKDQPSSPKGTRNDVGDLMWFDGDTNLVRSYLIPSTNPRRSATVVNYTVKGEHVADEGFVMRFAELRSDGRIELVTYGEGEALKQSMIFQEAWRPLALEAWTTNAAEVFRTASGR